MLASGFCFSGDDKLSTVCCGDELRVRARRSSSGGCEIGSAGSGDSRAGGGESRDGKGEAFGLLGGGRRMLLIGWPLRASLAELATGELSDAELPDGELLGTVGCPSCISSSNESKAACARPALESRRLSNDGGRVDNGMRGPPSSLFRR